MTGIELRPNQALMQRGFKVVLVVRCRAKGIRRKFGVRLRRLGLHGKGIRLVPLWWLRCGCGLTGSPLTAGIVERRDGTLLVFKQCTRVAVVAVVGWFVWWWSGNDQGNGRGLILRGRRRVRNRRG